MKLLFALLLAVLAASPASAEVLFHKHESRNDGSKYTIFLLNEDSEEFVCTMLQGSKRAVIYGRTPQRGDFILLDGCWHINQRDAVLIYGYTYTDSEELTVSYPISSFTFGPVQ